MACGCWPIAAVVTHVQWEPLETDGSGGGLSLSYLVLLDPAEAAQSLLSTLEKFSLKKPGDVGKASWGG